MLTFANPSYDQIKPGDLKSGLVDLFPDHPDFAHNYHGLLIRRLAKERELVLATKMFVLQNKMPLSDFMAPLVASATARPFLSMEDAKLANPASYDKVEAQNRKLQELQKNKKKKPSESAAKQVFQANYDKELATAKAGA